MQPIPTRLMHASLLGLAFSVPMVTAWADPMPVYALEAQLSTPPTMPEREDMPSAPRQALRTVTDTGLMVDTRSREAVRNFYNTIFTASEQASAQWTGNISGCVAGTVSQAYQDATLLRVNYFRAMAGIPAAVRFDADYNEKSQQAALMLSANNALSHNPPSSWRCYSAAGAQAAGNANISLGNAGPVAVLSQFRDDGAGNAAVGHRRWILYPQTAVMGTGDVVGQGAVANALWVFDSSMWGPRPAVRDDFVSWPPPGHVPYSLLFNRWSFSYPGADFSSASVTVQQQGQAVPVVVEPGGMGFGENTLVWIPSIQAAAAQQGDVEYRVSIRNVRIAGASRQFDYVVTAIDPAQHGADTVLPAISGTLSPVARQANEYRLMAVPGASAYQWKAARLQAFDQVEGAEAGLGLFSRNTSGDYAEVVSDIKASGQAGFLLAHSKPQPQILELTSSLFVHAGAQLMFSSRLGWASSDQYATVQVSVDEGANWQTVFTQRGTGTAGEPAFRPVSIGLAEYVGRNIQLRFVYDFSHGIYYPQSGGGVGWYFDDVRFSLVSSMQTGQSGEVTEPAFQFSPEAAGPHLLLARGMVGQLPLEWGPARLVTATEDTGGDAGATRRLTLHVDGPGTVQRSPGGTVFSSPGGTTEIDYAGNTVVTLQARPNTEAGFMGWNGACAGVADRCTLNLNGDRTVWASFTGNLDIRNPGTFVAQQYLDFLGRAGEPAGVDYWTDELQNGRTSRAAIVNSFFSSAEYQDGITPVTRLYFAYFDRVPDYAGLQHWIAAYQAGESLQAISQQFAQSVEFVQTYGNLNDAEFVDLVYRNVLGRAPEPQGNVFWLQALQQGLLRGQVMTQFSESDEYRQRTAASVQVSMMYMGLLRRSPDAAGFAEWVARLNQGQSVLGLIQGFIDSPEYLGRFSN
ncbi:Cysteine-rich secretory protein family protein [Lampropedia hyalina DSM 16112]|uniref:Cysteine-rich secretory protein family protein n=1 Tax=Lampropedia hyalina DSM 16112 TaxID=1122156 RepID=A0A1M5CF67_9BURK|nr:DUF4214 domain-containing protein [Lampropedia hyalina]SHF53414.1 Cysteine-rich secretory protein family protein [Lampropedia hyalina DSM 16112]